MTPSSTATDSRLQRGVAAWSAGLPVIMGVVNCTPDSFSDGGCFLEPVAAVAHGRSMIAEGAAILDVGGELILRGKGARGEILSRTVATDSEVIARGLIVGEEQGTAGHMECNGILLDGRASIHAIPELKAAHPDTELSHEAAVGKIAGEQLNYLMARGLPEEEARSLIIRGFLDVKIKGLPASLQQVIDIMIAQAMAKESI